MQKTRSLGGSDALAGVNAVRVEDIDVPREGLVDLALDLSVA
jgi:hypothetical protein